MTWNEVMESPSLQDLPFKIELNQYGQIVMSSTSRLHANHQTIITLTLANQLLEGSVFVECPIETSEGIRVPDIVWASDAFLARFPDDEALFTEAPEVCVEVLSPSNTPKEMREKVELFLNHGAKEVWLCDKTGSMQFFGEYGKLQQSEIFPHFPLQIKKS
jgi:Uma2 family endonuclease